MTDDKRPMNGREMEILEYVAALDVKLENSGEILRDRLKEIPNGWRQWRLIVTQTSKLLSQLYDTLPMKNLRHMDNICRHGEMIIRFKPASRPTDYKLLSDDDLKTLLRVCIKQECAICLREGSEVKRCELRHAMMDVAPLLYDIPTNTFGCGYQTIALNNVDEELK